MISRSFKPFNEEREGKVKEDSASSDIASLCQPDVEEREYVSIKNWAEEDRPREKLMAKGAEALTNAELFAILIGNGTSKKSAVKLMQEVLESCDGKLRNLNHLSFQDLMQFNGIGEAKALTIIAAAEIGKRRMMEDSKSITQFRSSADVLRYMQPLVQDLTFEKSWVLLLNNNASLISCVTLSSGGLTETSVDVRLLLKKALLHDATSFILVHNHPSGNMRPSRSDEELTMRVGKASQAVNIRMVDHVIVTDGDYYSFAENGKI